ncbi:uncharacterized protein LOC126398730 isoform X2 [Epinephelus moara]|uniref:uncharacterized protein LOC126398730 isoform X2 n=1 Tax=Epinephelus moara TaxID=300413 RepID=UPI00214F5845|nr:uncharacterized protein LOC126398730 isoform X2 [Epinephelus moara]
MGEFRWINKTLFLILLLQFTVTGQTCLSFTVRAGDEVTLPCEHVINSQDKCSGTSWLSSGSLGETAKELISHGQISSNVIGTAKSNRLNVTADCSLVIKKVTRGDVGRYTCRQFDESGQLVSDARVHLSVINMTEHKSDVLVILFCSVLTYEGCEHTVEWLYEGNENDVEISTRTCSAIVRFTPHPNQKSKYYESLKCNVTDKKNGETLLCDVGPQSSCEETGGTSAGRKNTTSAPKGWLWLYITLAVGSAVLLAAIIAAVVIRRKRNKGNKKPMDENYGQSLNPAVTQPDPETSQDMADPEDGVSYASVSYTKKTNSKAQALCKGDDDEGDVVTYSTVKASPSAAAATAGDSDDPSNLYATVNKENQ